jgi:hypothetical protein
VGEEFRRPLDLVDDRGTRQAREETPGIFEREAPDVGRFQGHAGVVGEGGAGEGGLPGLATSGQGHDRVGPGILVQVSLQETWDHAWLICD